VSAFESNFFKFEIFQIKLLFNSWRLLFVDLVSLWIFIRNSPLFELKFSRLLWPKFYHKKSIKNRNRLNFNLNGAKFSQFAINGGTNGEKNWPSFWLPNFRQKTIKNKRRKVNGVENSIITNFCLWRIK
jgi:hypothetical protein